ncbi:hypothetical protein PTNB73_03386 [Pyrenophora teres f. teres]|uniref:Uncharacterized protein n=1 Tax=Pyrenophora teres f. teres (strain 0-1) TaxID=861557 RepID=E3RFF4_PYRTT|nr:hypothetical protein PTT_06221 [Pyrenophora teres f. teres 0-1]KAE8871927.1 hypothetical protein PTNB73_03386 [Pyrenophora teres f. teres]
MAHNTSTSTSTSDPNPHPHNHPHNPSPASETHLQALLTAKLSAIPPYHLPTLTLSSILTQSPRALHIPHIPPDIQLAFFLRHRAAMDTYDGQPIKDGEKQHVDVTRAIWYYRTDERRQWVRYHDTTRWNLALFIALLAAQETSGAGAAKVDANKTNRNKHIAMASSVANGAATVTPSAHRFIISYLAAVIEHHNAPSTCFTAREAFVAKWKNTKWDVFSVFTGAQKKVLKNRLKVLGKEWELECEYAVDRLGREGFERCVGGFVGCVVPGRRDGGVSVAVGGKGENGGVGVGVAGVQGSGDVVHVMDMAGGNELLDALRVPYTPRVKAEKSQGPSRTPGGEHDGEAMTVTDVRHAIAAVLRMRPRDILPVLMRVFAEDK